MLGYESVRPESSRLRGTALEFRPSDLMRELQHNRYFVVLMAYDFQLLWKQKKHKLLWVTHFSISERRNAFDHNLPAISAAIVTGLPSFNLLKPHHGNPKANGDGVVRLPKFVVYAPKLLLTEPEVTSKSGQIL